MRKQLVAAAALLGAGALSLSPTTADAAGWTHTDDLSTTADTNVTGRTMDVVGYGDGFAAAVWLDNGPTGRRVMASRFRPNVGDGQWDAPVPISTAGRIAWSPTVEVNGNGDLAVAWSESHDGVEELYAAVQPAGGSWSAPRLLTPGATNVSDATDVGISDDRVVYATADYTDADDATFGVRVVEWDYPAAPAAPLTVTSNGGDASLDVSGSGEVVVAFRSYAQFTYAYTRHSPGGSWTAAATLGSADPLPPAAAVADNGRAAVAYVTNGSATVQLIDPDGTQHGSAATLSGDAQGAPALGLNDNGRLVAAWPDVDDADPSVATATAAYGGAWQVTETASPTPGVGRVEADIADTGAWAAGYAGTGRQVLLYRTRPAQPIETWVSPANYATHQAIASDDVGNVVALGALEAPDVDLHARYLDAVGPQTSTHDWPQQVLQTGVALTPSVAFTADGHDWLSGLASVDVVARVAAWNEPAYGDRTVLLDDRPASEPLPVPLQPGRSYCVGVRGTDGVGNLGPVTPEECFTTPLDDRALSGTGWQEAEGTAHYRGTITTTKTKGRFLVRKGVRARHLALVVAKSPTGGKVAVRLGHQLLGTYSLEGTGTRQLIDVADFAQVRTGALRITVVTDGKPVRIDGVVVAK